MNDQPERCNFDVAWVGKCKAVGTCMQHANLKCCCCGAKAARECDETMGLVCGSLLCDGCEHELVEDGTNGGRIAHVRKSEQKFKPWYAREDSQP